MTVSIISSGTIGGAQFADSLQGGGVGFQFGTSQAGLTAPINLIYARSDGANLISNFSIYLKAYSQTYGGEYSANSDLLKAIEQGGNGYGFQIDFVWDGVPFNVFTILTNALGTSPETAITVPVASLLYNSGGSAVDASAPVQGELGPHGNSVLGDTALFKCRWVVPAGEVAPGRRQIDFAYVYNFTT